MTDIYGRMYTVCENGETKVKIQLRSNDSTVRCGGRFKYIPTECDANYDSLVKALNSAIDKEAELTGGQYVTDKKQEEREIEQLDYDTLMNQFNTIINNLDLQKAMKKLNDIQKQIIYLILKGYEQKEIANLLKITECKVCRYKAAAFKTLKEELKEVC